MSKCVKLPHSLQQELGLELHPRGSSGRCRNATAGSRKQQRKAGRIEKRAARSTRSHWARQKLVEDALGTDDDRNEVPATSTQPADSLRNTERTSQSNTLQQRPKSILKRSDHKIYSNDSESTTSDRDCSPGLALDSTSRAFKDRAAQDDADILALEKKLGLKQNSKSKSFLEDGFDDLLEDFDTEDERKKRKADADEWLAKKRRKAATFEESESDIDDGASLEDYEIDLGAGDTGLTEDESETSDDDDFAGFESDSNQTPAAITSKKPRENPYVAPVDPSQPVGKYIPPFMRKRIDGDSESLTRLKRQVQGHLNKLSEANVVSILNQVEKFYQINARQDLTSTLIDLLLSLFCDRSGLQSTFVILHAAFVAAVYKVIGTDFGAEFVSKLVERFEGFYFGETHSTDKQTVNLISLLSHLYTFHVINCTIVYDYIRRFLQELSESNIELLLKVIQDCGPQLRQDDPSSLKGIVQMMQNSTAKLAAEGKETSVRTRFMIETIIDLKNNKMKAATNSSGVASEHITQMRKVLGSLNNRTLRASEPLRVGLSDIKDSDKNGKWWLVGASWKGSDLKLDESATESMAKDDGNDLDSQESDLFALARQYQMNTDVRRSIFVAIMSASDWQDAYLRLMKLRLKRSQEREVPKVLLRCAGAEAVYNPYHMLITKKLCSDKRMKMAFQFVLWDFFKRMGENGDLDDANDGEGEQGVELSEIVNLAKMYGHLIVDGALTIGVLKILNLTYLKEQAKMFVELLLVVILTQRPSSKTDGIDKKRLTAIFASAADTPQIVQGLQVFLKKHVRHSDLVFGKQRVAVKQACKAALEALDQIAAAPIQGSD